MKKKPRKFETVPNKTSQSRIITHTVNLLPKTRTPQKDDTIYKNVFEESKDRRIKRTFTTKNVKDSTKIFKLLRDHPRIELSQFDTIILDGSDTDILVEKLINDLHRQSSAIPPIYLTLLSLLQLPPELVKNRNALKKNQGDWIPF